MTIAKAFNEIAVAQGGTADTTGTIAGAIDAVNDALAGSDLPKKPRIEDGIRVLGQYIGGGGASFGPLQMVVTEGVLPTVENEYSGLASTFSISSGGTVIAGCNTLEPISSPIAAGLTAVSFAMAEYTECDAYVCSVGIDEEDAWVYTAVEPWDGTVTVGSIEQFGEQYATYTLTVPELDFDPETLTGEYLVLYVHS